MERQQWMIYQLEFFLSYWFHQYVKNAPDNTANSVKHANARPLLQRVNTHLPLCSQLQSEVTLLHVVIEGVKVEEILREPPVF